MYASTLEPFKEEWDFDSSDESRFDKPETKEPSHGKTKKPKSLAKRKDLIGNSREVLLDFTETYSIKVFPCATCEKNTTMLIPECWLKHLKTKDARNYCVQCTINICESSGGTIIFSGKKANECGWRTSEWSKIKKEHKRNCGTYFGNAALIINNEERQYCCGYATAAHRKPKSKEEL